MCITDSVRCIPKMDHHCPWTTNCVSHFTFPHFVRFLFYAVVGMSYLESCLFERASTIWASRHLPSVNCHLEQVLARLLTLPQVPRAQFGTNGSFIHPPCRQQLDCICAFHSLGSEFMVSWWQHHDYRIMGNRETQDASPASQTFWWLSGRSWGCQDTY